MPKRVLLFLCLACLAAGVLLSVVRVPLLTEKVHKPKITSEECFSEPPARPSDTSKLRPAPPDNALYEVLEVVDGDTLTAGAPVRLNNVVQELVNLDFTELRTVRRIDSNVRISFVTERVGWLYVELAPYTVNTGKLIVQLDGIVVLPIDNTQPMETMRFAKAGKHTLKIISKSGVALERLIVRSIPEIFFFNFMANHQPPLVVRDWDRMRMADIWMNYNVMVSQHPTPDYAPYVEQWRAKGGRYYRASSIRSGQWHEMMRDPSYDGLMIDEFLPTFSPEQCAEWVAAMEDIHNDPLCAGKSFYGFTSTNPATYESLVGPLLSFGFSVAPEFYMRERPSERAGHKWLQRYLINRMQKWRDTFPGIQEKMAVFLAPCDLIPRMSWDTYPQVNFHTYLEMQFQIIANNPAFEGLYGVGFWTAHNVSEETLGWYNRFVRHYLIEGNRMLLGQDPYESIYLLNPGFEEGDEYWAFTAAADDSISVIDADRLPFTSDWWYGKLPEGQKLLYTKRNASKPNIISQTIKNLVPGKEYVVKVYCVDLDNFTLDQHIGGSIAVRGATLVDASSEKGCYIKYKDRSGRPVKICWNCYRQRFRATDNRAELILSDWVSDNVLDGPVDQEIAWDFVKVIPCETQSEVSTD